MLELSENFLARFKEALAANRFWLDNTALILIMNTYWITENRPCLIYGLRGVIDLQIECSGPQRDLHSGVEGKDFLQNFHRIFYNFS